MKYSFRAVAVDYDGTLTQGARPSTEVLEALASARRSGLMLVLVTGRILAELLLVLPEATTMFDAIVAENGLVLWTEKAGKRSLAPAVPAALEDRLSTRGVATTRGDVFLATEARFDAVVLEEISRLGLDCQLVRNRAALMILPSGRSKGTGIGEALGELAISPHNVVAIGDAENDHSLLEACEIGIAVGNAIPSLKAHADIVLDEANGAGVTRFLHGLVAGSLPVVAPSRWRMPIGTRLDGTSVTLPASGINILIAGGSGSGKSYLAGLFAERLLPLGYSVCVLDPEGDHTELGHLRGTVTLGGTEGVPTPTQLGRLLHRRFGGAVVDLSLLRADERVEYTRAALGELDVLRAATGLPHWIFLDEAHAALGQGVGGARAANLDEKGYCLVTYRPRELRLEALEKSDIFFLLPRSNEVARTIFSLERFRSSDLSVDQLARTVAALPRGQALMVDARGVARAEVVSLGPRRSIHVRHRHKYVHGFLPPRHHFHFRDDQRATGRYAANLEDFHREILAASEDVLVHHARHKDFSRWLADVLQDKELASEVRDTECSYHAPSALRLGMIQAIESRYGQESFASHSG